MATVFCGGCGAASGRIVTAFSPEGKVVGEYCSVCRPEEFHDKFSNPSDKKIWIGPEYAPNDYERVNGELRMKPQAIADLEATAVGPKSVAATQEREAMERAIEKKRESRRTAPMSESELNKVMALIDRDLRPLIEDPETAYEV